MSSQTLLRNTLQAMLDADLSKNELRVGVAIAAYALSPDDYGNNLTLKGLAELAGINTRGGMDRIEKPIRVIIANDFFECEAMSSEILSRLLRDSTEYRQSEYIYLVTDGVNTKIGVAVDLKKRLSGLQTGNATQLRFVFNKKVSSPFRLERRLHKKFKAQHIRGEWFKLNRRMTSQAVTIINMDGNQQ